MFKKFAVLALAALFFGLKCAVLVLVVEALLRVAKRALKGRVAWALAAAAFVALFLSVNSIGAVYRDEEGLILGQFVEYAYPLVIGTLVASLIALALATPVAIGVALYISHFAPPRLSTSIGRRSRSERCRCQASTSRSTSSRIPKRIRIEILDI